MWNVYDKVQCIEHLPRTNNAIEGFHSGFEPMLQMIKTDDWKFLEAIHCQHALQKFTVALQKRGLACSERK